MSYGDSYGQPHRRGGDRYEEYMTSPRGRAYRDYGSNRSMYREDDRPRHRGSYGDEQERRTYYRERESYGGRRETCDGPPPRRVGRPRPQNDGDIAQPCKVLGVFGLSTRTAERDLYNIFSAYGRVRDIQMVYDSLTGRSRGFAFVYYESTDDARRAKANCDQGLEIDGRMARVDYSMTNAAHPPTPGIYMGKFRRYECEQRDVKSYDRRERDDGRRYERDERTLEPRHGFPLYSRQSVYDGPLQRRGPPHRNDRSSRSGRYGSSGGIRRRRTMSSSRSRSPPPIYSGGRGGGGEGIGKTASAGGDEKQQQTVRMVTPNGRSRSNHSFDSLSPENQPKLLEQTWPDDEVSN